MDSTAWTYDPRGLKALFSAEERARLDAARRAVTGDGQTVVYCVFENPFAKSGGIFAVAENLAGALGQGRGDVVLLSPLHQGLATRPSPDQLLRLGEFKTPFRGELIPTELFEHSDAKGNRWILLRADGFFDADGGAGRGDPYSHGSSWLLLRDALFACAAAPVALNFLGLREKLIVHAQDWQFASLALTVKLALLEDVLKSAAVVLTSHNPYDHALPESHLAWLTDRWDGSCWPFGRGTVYERMIPLMDAPVSTVSTRFAHELTSDPVQAHHFAHHLQVVYRMQTVVGIDNPLFGDSKPVFSSQAVAQARAGNPRPILAEKRDSRMRMLRMLGDYHDDRMIGSLDAGAGRPLEHLAEDVPVFLMFGRLDPAQKGFDLLARAVEALPEGAARFVLTPIVSAGAEPWLGDFRNLAAARPGEVAVYPFRMEKGYPECQAGASFAVMPSFYEPFGAATEAYLKGTPVVARATGGLTNQVVDYGDDPANATGLLFRERLPLTPGWPALLMAGNPTDRVALPLYSALVEALVGALEKAILLWRSKPAGYGQMLANLHIKAASFSRERAAKAYGDLYALAAADRPRI